MARSPDPHSRRRRAALRRPPGCFPAASSAATPPRRSSPSSYARRRAPASATCRAASTSTICWAAGPWCSATRIRRWSPRSRRSSRADDVLPGERAHARAGRGDLPRGAVRRADPIHVHGHGGHVLGAPGGARVPQARQDPEVRGRVPRHPRLLADEREPAVAQGVPGPDAGLGGHPARHPGAGPGRAVQRPGRDGGHRRRAPSGPGRGHPGAVPAAHRARPRVPPGRTGDHAPVRRAAHLRRDRHRIPLRLRRRAGVLRRGARPGRPRQDHRRRLPARRGRRAGPRSCGTWRPPSRARRSSSPRPAP